jgi:iron complex transport system substrate-binding protein
MKKMVNKKRISIFVLLVMMISLFASCAGSKTSTSNTDTKKGAFPVTITDSFGRKVTLDKKPEKIISLAPNITETVAALNASDRLVGRTDYCDYPENIKSVQSIGTMQQPNIEKIVDLKPDIVVASSIIKKDVVEKLEKLNVKAAVISGVETFDGVYQTIENVAKLIGEDAAAAKVVADMKKKVNDITEKVKSANKPKVYYVVGFGQTGDYTAGKGTFIDELIKMAGGTNTAGDVQGWKYSLEKIVENDPDIMICSKYYDTKKGITAANGYKDLRAVKEGKLLEIDNNMLDRQGPRMADGLEALAKIIHPELFK